MPVDYAKPQGAQAQLAVIRVPATGTRIGVLMVNPGGPGASAVDTVAGWARRWPTPRSCSASTWWASIRAGVGHSTPQLRCRTDAEFDAYRREPMADYSPAGVAHIEELHQQFAAECLDRMGTDFLANIGTAAAARDMDVVRAALGEDRINYLGFSYGTQLGAAYADRYPDRVRAMVLDGAVDPSLDPISQSIRQMAGFQTAFNKYAADCAQSAGCPLGADPGAVRQSLPTARRSTGHPPRRRLRPAWPRVSGCDHRNCQRALLAALLDIPDQRPAGIAARHRAGDLLSLADDYQRRDKDGHYKNRQDAFAPSGASTPSTRPTRGMGRRR